MRKIILLFFPILSLAATTHAQTFSSGSTGADGALDLSTSGCSNIAPNVCVVQLPESGVLNYTTVSIPSGKLLVFKRNYRNTPVYMLAQSNVDIAGDVYVSGGNLGFSSGCNTSSCEGRVPGPGGFYGGMPGQAGFGPGGGAGDPNVAGGNGQWVGSLSLVPVIGGSGGGGGGGLGGGGGGAIVIASSTSITFKSGRIFADGSRVNLGSFGAGGAIRLVANSITVTQGFLSACGGPNCGVIRLEAPAGALTFNGIANPPAGLFPINPIVIASALPVLTFVSIGGFPVPSYAGQRFDTYDMLLPNQLTDPISVVVQANNIPVGTQVTVGFVNGSPNGTSTPGTLAGTFESSSATASISNLNRTAVTYLLATATFDPPMSAMKFNPKGQNRVAKIRVIASPGAKPKFVFLRSNGTEVNQAKLSKRFLEELGL
jgi:hypothetical protein